MNKLLAFNLLFFILYTDIHCNHDVCTTRRYLKLDLHDGKTSARYTLSIHDLNVRKIPKGGRSCAVFLTPQGREHDWQFSAAEGKVRVLSKTNPTQAI